MNSFEIDPIIGGPPEVLGHSVEVTESSLDEVRARILDLLESVAPEVHEDVEDDEIILYTSKTAEFKLPNGDRVHLKYAFDESSKNGGEYRKSGLNEYEIHHYEPIDYSDNGFLEIQVRRYSFSIDSEELEELAVSTNTMVKHIPPPDFVSPLEDEIAALKKSRDTNKPLHLDLDILSAVIESVSESMRLAELMDSFDAQDLAYVWSLLCALEDRQKVGETEIKWNESAW